MMWPRTCIPLLIIIFLPLTVFSDGIIALQILSYNNPLSISLDGEECAGQCVNTFTLTTSTRVRTAGIVMIEVEQVESDSNIGDVHSFSGSLGSDWSNPLEISFAGEVRLVFSVAVTGVEKNYPNNEYSMALFTFNSSGAMAEERVALLSGSATLTFSYTARCSDEYYGNGCETHCSPVPTRYTCSIITGEKICLDGWTGSQCDQSTETSSESSPEDGSSNGTGGESAEGEERGEAVSHLGLSFGTLWRIIAICCGVVLGFVILSAILCYHKRNRKKARIPRIVVSKERLFKKTGHIPTDTETTSPPPVRQDEKLSSGRIPNPNSNSTPPPVENPDYCD